MTFVVAEKRITLNARHRETVSDCIRYNDLAPFRKSDYLTCGEDIVSNFNADLVVRRQEQVVEVTAASIADKRGLGDVGEDRPKTGTIPL